MPKKKETLNSDPQSAEKLHRALSICIFQHRMHSPLWPQFDMNQMVYRLLKGAHI